MIDQDRLRELIDDFGVDDLGDLIESFLEEAEATVISLEAEVSDDYSKERADLFHFLKGCALNVGAMELADLCEAYEHRQTGFSVSEYQSVKADFAAVQTFFVDGGLKQVA